MGCDVKYYRREFTKTRATHHDCTETTFRKLYYSFKGNLEVNDFKYEKHNRNVLL